MKCINGVSCKLVHDKEYFITGKSITIGVWKYPNTIRPVISLKPPKQLSYGVPVVRIMGADVSVRICEKDI